VPADKNFKRLSLEQYCNTVYSFDFVDFKDVQIRCRRKLGGLLKK
jgi:hypothetical protein